jgi:histidyl-tRNA synthetase
MSEQIKVIRGMHDILPEQINAWHQVEDGFRQLAEGFGYRQIRTPIVEKTALFKRSIGEVTDIVEKEMYTFEDRNGDSLSLRPENTASVVRAGIEHGLLVNQQQRWWYNGPMFRHERPQKGRYRQFHQLGAETFGMPGADIEAELILLAARLWSHLGLGDIHLELNTLGTAEDRGVYRDVLVTYFSDHADALDDDSRRRLDSNPLRILDSKNPDMQNLIDSAPRLEEHLRDESRAHFGQLLEILDHVGQDYTINTRLVRGLDYYSHTVFEWVTESLGAQGTVCAGGRYDGLIDQLGGKPTPAAGFAMGVERLVAMMHDQQLVNATPTCDVYFAVVGEAALKQAHRLAIEVRDQLPRLGLVVHAGGGSFKSQMKKANKSGARLALILGENELQATTINIKHLRADLPQQSVAQNALVSSLKDILYPVQTGTKTHYGIDKV